MNVEDVRILTQLKEDIAQFRANSQSHTRLKRFTIHLTSDDVIRLQFIAHSQSKIVVCRLLAHHAQLFVKRSEDIDSLYIQALELFCEHQNFLKSVSERSQKLHSSLTDVRYVEEKLREYSRRYFTKKDFHKTASSKATPLSKDSLTYGKISPDRNHHLDFILDTNARVLGAMLTFNSYPLAYLISDAAEEIEKFTEIVARSHIELVRKYL